MNKKYYREYIDKIIEQNPVYIEIKRTIEQRDDYGNIKKNKVTLSPQKVFIYNKTYQKDIIKDKGSVVQFMASNIEKLLAKHDADIKEGDTFEIDNRQYKVLYPENYMDICIQAELEVIKQ